MARQAIFPNATLSQFCDLFQAKKEYRDAINEMDLKERAFNWKPTTELEKQLKAHLTSNALIKFGSGGLKVTSYRVQDGEGVCRAYLSFGGKRLRVTSEGRDGDVGFFLTATQTPAGLSVEVKTKSEHYKGRTWLVNAFWLLVGLFCFVVPALLIAVWLFVVEPRMDNKQIDRVIWPPLSVLLGARQ